MLSTLARQFGIALLATCVTTAPVLGSMPRCCKTGAVAGSGNCCCGPRTSAKEQEADDEVPSCCAKRAATERSCCAEQQESSEPSNHLAGDATSRCCCKVMIQPLAVLTGKDGIETRDEDSIVDLRLRAEDATPFLTVVRTSVSRPGGSLKIPLRKIYCRWTV